MKNIVEPEASHGLYILQSQGRQQQPYIGNIVCNFVLSKDVANDDLGLLSLGNVCYAFRQDSISVVYLAIPGKEADESLCKNVVSAPRLLRGYGRAVLPRMPA